MKNTNISERNIIGPIINITKNIMTNTFERAVERTLNHTPQLKPGAEILKSLFKSVDYKHFEQEMFGDVITLSQLAANPKQVNQVFRKIAEDKGAKASDLEFLSLPDNSNFMDGIIEVLTRMSCYKALEQNNAQAISLLLHTKPHPEVINEKAVHIPGCFIMELFVKSIEANNVPITECLLKFNPDLVNIFYKLPTDAEGEGRSVLNVPKKEEEVYKLLLEHTNCHAHNYPKNLKSDEKLFIFAKGVYDVASFQAKEGKFPEGDLDFAFKIFKNYINKNIKSEDLESYKVKLKLYEKSMPDELFFKLNKHIDKHADKLKGFSLEEQNLFIEAKLSDAVQLQEEQASLKVKDLHANLETSDEVPSMGAVSSHEGE